MSVQLEKKQKSRAAKPHPPAYALGSLISFQACKMSGLIRGAAQVCSPAESAVPSRCQSSPCRI